MADSKLMTQEHVTKMNNKETRIEFVSRCPANFGEKIESKMISKAYASDSWVEYGSFSETKGASTYRGVGFTQEVYGGLLRFVVLESSSLVGGVEGSFEKQKAALEPVIKKLTRSVYGCLGDAEAAWKRFRAQKQARLFDFEFDIVEHVGEIWPKGRPGRAALPKIVKTYQLVVKVFSRNEAAYAVFAQGEFCIVLVSNAVDRSDREIVLAYKGQFVVENSFRALKSPQVASVIYLKNPRRIGVLSMLLVFSLLVRALIEFRLRVGLEVFREQHSGGSLCAGWGGRELVSPTFKLFYEHAFNCCFEREKGVGCFSFSWPHERAEVRVGVLLLLMGYSLEQLVA